MLQVLAKMTSPFSFPLTKGLSRDSVPCKADLATFYTMTNFRPVRGMLGAVEQTPRFYAPTTGLTRYNYNIGAGNVLDPATSSVRMTIGSTTTFAWTDNTAQLVGTGQVPAFVKTVEPVGTGLTKSLLIVITNFGLVTATLGNAYDIVIDSATTFKWRVNGGAYTLLVPIATGGQTIDGGAVTLYWLTATGFTVNDTWTLLYSNRTTGRSPIVFQDKVYYMGDHLMVMEDTLLSPTGKVIRSAGYRNVTGTSVNIFENHIMVFGTSADMSVASGSYIAQSDNVTAENFTATDVNEADITRLLLSSSLSSPTTLLVYCGAVFLNRLFVITNCGIYYTDYLGLPVVFSFKQLLPYTFSNFSTMGQYCISTPQGIFFSSGNYLYLFDGSALKTLVDYSRIGGISASNVAYDSKYQEVTVMVNISALSGFYRLLTYSIQQGIMYLRGCHINSLAPTWLTMIDGVITLGGDSLALRFEDVDYTHTPKEDAISAAFITPTLCTQLIGGTASKVKEDQANLYICPTVATGGSGFYSIGANIKVVVSWYLSTDGLISGTPATHTSAFWVNTKPDGIVSFPRVAYRFIAYELTLVGLTAGKPPGPISIQCLETMLTANNATR